MSDPKRILTKAEIDAVLPAGWQLEADSIRATFPTGDFATGLKLVNLIGDSAEAANHHPDVLLTYPQVGVTLASHDVGGVTSRDIDLAGAINLHAARLGVGQ